MENLYDNLENYEDANIIHDLKNENKELKSKLEQYSSSMKQLQKDFDKLSSEYKNLERNYSSLLKTAKAEIERKTQIITNLNIEKDMLVIKTFQTKGASYLKNMKRNMYSNINNPCSSKESQQRESKTVKVGNKDQMDVTDSKNDSKVSKQNETKENMPDSEQIGQVKKIMNRRESVPASSILADEDKPFMFKSEDENSQCNNPTQNQRGYDYDCDDRRSNRASDTLSADNAFSYGCQSSQQSRYRGKHDRANKFEESYRYNDRVQPHWQGRYRESERQFDYERRMDRKSSDRYRRNKSRDRRCNYSNEYPRECEVLKHNFQSQAVKHKRPPHFDEPSQKKLRVDSYGEYLNVIHANSERDYHEKASSTISPEDPYRSCQSPDQLTAGYNDQHLVKEIMHTAATPLEDPRISSKKYVLKTENHKSVLTTVSSQERDIKPIDKSLWQLPKIDVPDALLQKPPTRKSDSIVSEVYASIDNFELNMSLESGEIPTIDDEVLLLTRPESVKSTNKSDNNYIKGPCKEQHQENKYCSGQPPTFTTKPYKIPKLSETTKNQDNVKTDMDKTLLKETSRKEEKERNSLNLPEKIIQGAQIPPTLPKISDLKDNRPKDDIHDKQNVIGMIENDLLLSDDASDNMDLLKQKQLEEGINNKSKNNCTSEAKTNDSVVENFCKKSDNNAHECSQQGQEKDDTTSSKKEGTGTKTKKAKKKLETKPKEPNKDLVTKKTKKEKESKVSEIKTKFSDLFGESSSLIMPEDLGLEAPAVVMAVKNDKFDSIFDDTQSAVDLQLEQKDTIENKSKQNNETLCKDEDAISLPLDPKTSVIFTDKIDDSSEGNKQCLKNTESNDHNLYENLNAEVSMDGANVVIISTGMQPSHNDNNMVNDHVTNNSNFKNVSTKSLVNDHVTNNSNFKNVSTKSFMPALKALATSTPLKINVEPTCEKNEPVAKDTTNQSSNNIDSSTNSSNVQVNEADVPDVRIFVKRRRKVKKP